MQKGPPEARETMAPLSGGGEMGALMRAKAWDTTPLGAVETWPQSLQVALRLLLTSRYAMWLGWGPELAFFYNDAYAPTLGVKHPGSLGRSAREVWAEIWRDIGPRADTVMREGIATWDEGLLLFLERSGEPEETYHTFSYSPVPDDHGGVGGLLCVVTEETERVLGERRLALLHELASAVASTKTEAEVSRALGAKLSEELKDLPFSLAYVFDADGRRARLAFASGIAVGHAAAPPSLDLSAEPCWPARAVLERGSVIKVADLAQRFEHLPCGAWDKPAREALLIPLSQQGQLRPAGFVVAAVNPYRPLDAAYRGFMDLLGGQIASGFANAHAYEQERLRAEALAELDRAKTAFFSNVSHEFRTPLTLMLGPIDDLLQHHAPKFAQPQRDALALVRRNGQRLLKLVNSLLDFSRIEAGRVQASYEPTDLAAFTAELASVFRAAIERAQMRLSIDCPPLPEPIYVDREMWEKIVLNLVSNAFKYTLEGAISVQLRAADGAVTLSVSDTGTGIPEAELPKLFNRFHRVEGARGRTHEGTGIGLALVQELAKLHGGTVGVRSKLGEGSEFTVSIARGKRHLPHDRIRDAGAAREPAIAASGFVEEALRWLPAAPAIERLSSVDTLGNLGAFPTHDEAPARVLVADDNADMRDYVSRLLRDRYQVIAADDGQEALEKVHEARPDLVLTDVMMPNLDGFGLLKALRADPRTQTIPLIMLSARAGEEARVEGLDAGADDYIIKPFSARELVARVAGALALARARREALRREQELRAETTDVLESITEGFIALDAGFHVTYLNAEAERMIGQPRARSLGQQLWDVFPAARELEFQRELSRALLEAKPSKLENYYEPWRKWFEVDVYPKHPGLALYFRDITERKLKTEQLHALAEAAVVVNSNLSIPDTLRVVTERARSIIGAHQAIAIFAHDQRWPRGVQARSFSAKYAAWSESGPADGVAALYRLVCDHNQPLRFTQAELETQAAFATLDMAAAHLPPYQGWLAVPLVGGDGKNMGLVQLSEKYDGEFSEQDEAILMQLAQLASVAIANAQLYQTTQEARADSEAANRMKDQFLATLSHELRTPLNAILGWARILQSGRIEESVLKQGLETIERNSRVQAQLIEDLLDLSRIISGKLRLEVQRVNLVEVVEGALASTRPAADAKEIRCLSILDPLAGPVNGDPARLQQIVWNLLSNAVKFTPRGGRIQVVLERVNSLVEISVIDNGLGIKPDFLPYVFDRFRQADGSTTRRHGGLGLGLSIVRQLAEMHGGTVRARSPGEGMGSTFTISLPVMIAHEHDATPERTQAELPALDPPLAPLEGVKVLVVDDEPDARELIRRILADSHAEVSAAGSVHEALALVDRFGPHILLSDIGMPDEDGFELIRRLRLAGWGARTLPAVALTAFARSEDRRRALLAGFQVHIAKPVDPGELVATIASLLGRTGAA